VPSSDASITLLLDAALAPVRNVESLSGVVRDGAERVEDGGLGTVVDDGIGPARVRRGLIDGAGPDWSFRSAAC